MSEIIITAANRNERGKNAARRLRRQGMIPATIYGGKGEATAVSVDPKILLRVLRSETGRNTILKLDLGSSGSTSAILKSWPDDPGKENFLHADFFRIAMDVAIKVTVPVAVKGEARGVKVDAGILELILREIEVECLPGDIPERIEIDVTDLGIHGSIRVSDLPISNKVKVLEDADQVVSRHFRQGRSGACCSGCACRRRGCRDAFRTRSAQEGQERRRGPRAEIAEQK